MGWSEVVCENRLNGCVERERVERIDIVSWIGAAWLGDQGCRCTIV